MVTYSNEITTEVRAGMRGGAGSVQLSLFKDFLPAKMRLLGTITLGKGDEVGKHDHVGETEVYFILSGEGIGDDNGTEVVLKKGDAMFTGGGAYHSLRNEKDEPLTFFAVIVLD